MATYGELFTKKEAEEQFGSVIKSVVIKRSDLESYVKQSPDNLMFKLQGNGYIALNKNRSPLHGKSPISAKEVFNNFSTSKVQELLNAEENENLEIEIRESGKLSISNGATVLEFSSGCPPYC